MAKYTQLLAEYLEDGGKLPAVFSQIDGFDELFIGQYCDSEIAFETPVLFGIKLEMQANLVIHAYAKRIIELEGAHDLLQNPNKKHVRTGGMTRIYGNVDNIDTNTKQGSIERTIDQTNTNTNAEKVHTEADLPFAGANETDILTRKTKDEQYIDSAHTDSTDTERYNNYEDRTEHTEAERIDTEMYDNITDVEAGYNAAEAESHFRLLNETVNIILRECLKEFENLFMQIY